MDARLRPLENYPEIEAEAPIAWGKEVPPEFKRAVLWIERELTTSADDLMSCLAVLTCRTWDPVLIFGWTGMSQIREHYGLNAQLPITAKLTSTQQLIYVYYYLKAFPAEQVASWSLSGLYRAFTKRDAPVELNIALYLGQTEFLG